MEYEEICPDASAKIKVIGVGGGGGNAINNMIAAKLSGVSFVAANTDLQDLNRSQAEVKIQLGPKLTKGLGAGGNPAIGCEAARESIAQIQDALGAMDMLFIANGMGGGTGTGAAPIIAQAAKETGALVVGVVTMPFLFERAKCMRIADAGVAELRKHVDSLIILPNSRLAQFAPKNATVKQMFKVVDDVLLNAVRGISDLLTVPGMQNLDFADIKAVMGGSGQALMGTGAATGESRAREAVKNALNSPLLADITVDGAMGLLVNITANEEMGFEEYNEAATMISENVHEDANVFIGMAVDNNAGDEMRITVIATGMQSNHLFVEKTANPRVITLDPAIPRGLPTLPNKAAVWTPAAYKSPLEQEAKKRDEAKGGGGVQDYVKKHPAGDYSLPAYLRAQSPLSKPAKDREQQGKAAGAGGAHGPESAEEFFFEHAGGKLRANTPSLGLEIKSMQCGGYNPGEDEFIFGEDEMDAPAFIKTLAN
ncbi:MAG: cell division protein FtsZ [Deltaproteobacteria bacterium]|jgi:cell division protein FtsZ|nr:cell division protein FtsZ [Deltaproteobacteria bacterium]